jgi:predicted AlkP superfamily phosphohydrolase/phosphomutase
MKILIIGLDGATWDVLDDFVLDNYMPNLKRLKTGGYSGILRSTDPPITPAAWITCITGCQPYTHGVVGFKDYSFEDERLRISSARSCRVPTMWEEFSNQGYKVASINVPWTYPCPKVNGAIIAGYGLPNTQVQFTYPDDLKDRLLESIPDYDVMAKWEKSENHDPEIFEANIVRVERSFEQRLQAARMLSAKTNFDVMMVQFHDLDMMQHHIWACLGSGTRDSYVSRRDRIFSLFKKLDEAIAGLLELAGTEQLDVAVVSDHGFGPMFGSIRANMLLYDWGYLKFQSPFARMIRRLRRNLPSSASRESFSMPIELKTPVDWKRSRAMVIYAAMNGHIYLNVRGRNQHGCVERGAEYDSIIEDLRQRFSRVTNPATGKPIFTQVVTPAELYNVDVSVEEQFGDLILVPVPGYIVHQSTSRKGNCIKLQPKDSVGGCHYCEGMYIFHGPNIKKGRNRQAHIVNIAPTIYALLGAKMPKYLDGTVWEEMFIEKIPVTYQESGDQAARQARGKEALSTQEEAEIAKRLSALGYLE